jgi:hypothetical protein
MVTVLLVGCSLTSAGPEPVLAQRPSARPAARATVPMKARAAPATVADVDVPPLPQAPRVPLAELEELSRRYANADAAPAVQHDCEGTPCGVVELRVGATSRGVRSTVKLDDLDIETTACVAKSVAIDGDHGVEPVVPSDRPPTMSSVVTLSW